MNKTAIFSCFFLDEIINLDKTQDVFVANIIQCILNTLFSPLPCLGNFVILHAIRKSQDLHSPSFILLCCLAFSDLLVGAICQPSLVAFIIAELVDNVTVYCKSRIIHVLSAYITAGVSGISLAAVSVDRVLALTLHLRYETIVTVPRVFQTAFVLWLFSITVVLLRLWISITAWNFIIFSLVLATLIVITLCTSKTFQIVRTHQRQINDQNMAALSFQTNTVNVLKCRKSALTVIYLYGLFLAFYLPFFIIVIIELFIGYTRAVKIADEYASTAVFNNSLLNPLVYCLRIRQIRRAVKNSLPGRWAA